MSASLTEPQYSIIVPVYNVENYLAECIDSLLAQDTAEAYEVILVDDGSTDSSDAICDAYAARDARIRVIHQKNGGVSSARNAGMASAKGVYLFFVDSDDTLDPQFLSVFRSLFETEPDLALCSHICVEEHGQEKAVPLPLIPTRESGQTYLTRLFAAGKLPRPYVWSVAFRRAFLTEHRLVFREDLPVSEDFEFIMRCFSCARQVQGVDSSLYRYRMRSDSLSHQIFWRKLRGNLQVKAAAYRENPCGALANYFADSALLISRVPDGKQSAAQMVRDNIDILKEVTQPPLKVYRWMVTLLGPWQASRLYLYLRGLRDALRDRKESKSPS